MHDIGVEAVFYVWNGIRNAEQPIRVGLVLREEHLRHFFCLEPHSPEGGMVGGNHNGPGSSLVQPEAWLLSPWHPRPGIAEPESRQQVQRRGFGTAVYRGDTDQQIIDAAFGVLDEHV